jgi:hypothetical protein
MQLNALVDACQQCIDAGKTLQITWQQYNFVCMPIKLAGKTAYIIAMQTTQSSAQLLRRLEPWRYANLQTAYIQQKLCLCCVLAEQHRNAITEAIGLLLQLT